MLAPMIPVGTQAPDFTLLDQNGQSFTLSAHRGRAVLLLWYPADFTPTCSMEVPALDDRRERFADANVVVAAISTDSRFSHKKWCDSFGGITIPVLADTHPHGAVSQAYGAWIPGESISDRATVIVDPWGRVAYAHSVGKDGRRDIDELLAIARQIGPTLRLR